MTTLEWLQKEITTDFDGPEVIDPTDDLVNDCNLDSLDLVELAMSAEEEFDIEMPGDISFRDVPTVQAFADLIDKQRAKVADD